VHSRTISRHVNVQFDGLFVEEHDVEIVDSVFEGELGAIVGAFSFSHLGCFGTVVVEVNGDQSNQVLFNILRPDVFILQVLCEVIDVEIGLLNLEIENVILHFKRGAFCTGDGEIGLLIDITNGFFC
jgi:hypothetical protein